MDETVKGLLDSYRGMLAPYETKLPEGHPTLRAYRDFFNQVEKIAETSKDYFEFTDESASLNWMARFSELLAEAAMAALNESPASTQKPTASQAASAYHHAFEALPKDGCDIEKKIYAELFQIEKESRSAPEFLKRIFEKKIPLRLGREPVVAMYQKALADTRGKSLPSMEVFNAQASEIVAKSNNVVQIEYETNRLALLSNLETVWDQLALNTVYLPLGNAVASWDLTHHEDDRHEVENSVRFLGELFSLTPEGLLSLPRIQGYVTAMIVPSIRKKRTDYSYAVYTQETLRSVASCLKDKPQVEISKGNDFLEFYGKKIPLGEWHLALENPPRN